MSSHIESNIIQNNGLFMLMLPVCDSSCKILSHKSTSFTCFKTSYYLHYSMFRSNLHHHFVDMHFPVCDYIDLSYLKVISQGHFTYSNNI